MILNDEHDEFDGNQKRRNNSQFAIRPLSKERVRNAFCEITLWMLQTYASKQIKADKQYRDGMLGPLSDFELPLNYTPEEQHEFVSALRSIAIYLPANHELDLTSIALPAKSLTDSMEYPGISSADKQPLFKTDIPSGFLRWVEYLLRCDPSQLLDPVFEQLYGYASRESEIMRNQLGSCELELRAKRPSTRYIGPPVARIVAARNELSTAYYADGIPFEEMLNDNVTQTTFGKYCFVSQPSMHRFLSRIQMDLDVFLKRGIA
jgi:hypothetical protein